MDQITTSYWAMLMFDSSTKFPESVLMGQSVFLGNFDECIEVEHVNTGVGVFSGQHCLAEFRQKPDSVQKLSPQNLPHVESLRIRAPNVRGNDRTVAFDLSDLSLTLSYCIPSTCSAKDFEGIFNSYLQDMNLPLMTSVAEEYCQTNEGKSLATEDWITVGILAAFLLLIVSNTAYDLIGKGQKKELLLAFSVYSNGKKLLSTKSSGDTLQAVHGIRFITICWVILGHRYKEDSEAPNISLSKSFDFLTNPGRLYITNSTLSVDTFFVLSGLLLGYIFLKQMKHKTSGFNIPMFYVHRYIRLTPPYAIVILINATLYRYVGSGPLLPASANQMAENCQSNWWTNIIYINNYFDMNRTCVPQSWYLSVDMQLFLLSPIVLYPLWKWPRKWNFLLLGTLAIAGVVSPFTISYVEEVSATFFVEKQMAAGFEKAQLYYATYSRFGPWIIGVIFGYLVYEAKRKELKLSLIQVTAGWILSIVAMLASLDGIYSFYQPDADKTLLESAFYNGLFRNVWAFGVGVTIFLCVTGYGGPVNTLLSWRVITPLSRLTYCVYLTHLNYQIVESRSARTPIYLADLTELPTFLSDVIISLILAVILCLGFEAPAINLEKHLLGRGRKTKQNIIEEASPQKQEGSDKAYTNKLTEEPVALGEGIHNITEVVVKDTREDRMEHQNKE
ncbi:nose resistant to fluoxetine protein 6-like [Cryptotermes secundus]|uniref:nose resistant to fluoxetine protein 6-like n=1 Tax=Cryptotermes secundus TaxID=105785 RepID=UPI001454CB1A|nr:nose resistant to fluoxetine protein 6-like [Cryptotermes secundus]